MNFLSNDENTILFTIGRMNPPTTGHKLLIQSMMDQAIRLHLNKIYIILSATVDDLKNPFECEEKRAYLYGKSISLEKKINGILSTIKTDLKRETPDPTYASSVDLVKVEVICMNDETPPEYGNNPIMKSVLSILNSEGYPQRENLKMILMIGQDRATDFNWIGSTLSQFQPPVHFQILPISRPKDAVSATLIRHLALSNDWEHFFAMMEPLGLPMEDLKEIYEEIQKRIRPLKGGRTKRGRKNRRSKKTRKQRRKQTRK